MKFLLIESQLNQTNRVCVEYGGRHLVDVVGVIVTHIGTNDTVALRFCDTELKRGGIQ